MEVQGSGSSTGLPVPGSSSEISKMISELARKFTEEVENKEEEKQKLRKELEQKLEDEKKKFFEAKLQFESQKTELVERNSKLDSEKVTLVKEQLKLERVVDIYYQISRHFTEIIENMIGMEQGRGRKSTDDSTSAVNMGFEGMSQFSPIVTSLKAKIETSMENDHRNIESVETDLVTLGGMIRRMKMKRTSISTTASNVEAATSSVTNDGQESTSDERVGVVNKKSFGISNIPGAVISSSSGNDVLSATTAPGTPTNQLATDVAPTSTPSSVDTRTSGEGQQRKERPRRSGRLEGKPQKTYIDLSEQCCFCGEVCSDRQSMRQHKKDIHGRVGVLRDNQEGTEIHGKSTSETHESGGGGEKLCTHDGITISVSRKRRRSRVELEPSSIPSINQVGKNLNEDDSDSSGCEKSTGSGPAELVDMKPGITSTNQWQWQWYQGRENNIEGTLVPRSASPMKMEKD